MGGFFLGGGIGVMVALVVMLGSYVSHTFGKKAFLFFGNSMLGFSGAISFLVFLPMLKPDRSGDSMGSLSSGYGVGSSSGSTSIQESHNGMLDFYHFLEHPFHGSISVTHILGIMLLIVGVVFLIMMMNEMAIQQKNKTRIKDADRRLRNGL